MAPDLTADPAVRSVSDLLRSLWCPTVWEILRLGAGKSWYVSQLARELGITQPAMTRHVARLESLGLGKKSQRKDEVHFRTDVPALEERLGEALQIVHPWGVEGIVFLKRPPR
jgi:DNA-binding MarR family transcriptional regulator